MIKKVLFDVLFESIDVESVKVPGKPPLHFGLPMPYTATPSAFGTRTKQKKATAEKTASPRKGWRRKDSLRREKAGAVIAFYDKNINR